MVWASIAPFESPQYRKTVFSNGCMSVAQSLVSWPRWKIRRFGVCGRFDGLRKHLIENEELAQIPASELQLLVQAHSRGSISSTRNCWIRRRRPHRIQGRLQIFRGQANLARSELQNQTRRGSWHHRSFRHWKEHDVENRR